MNPARLIPAALASILFVSIPVMPLWAETAASEEEQDIYGEDGAIKDEIVVSAGLVENLPLSEGVGAVPFRVDGQAEGDEGVFDLIDRIEHGVCALPVIEE